MTLPQTIKLQIQEDKDDELPEKILQSYSENNKLLNRGLKYSRKKFNSLSRQDSCSINLKHSQEINKLGESVSWRRNFKIYEENFQNRS